MKNQWLTKASPTNCTSYSRRLQFGASVFLFVLLLSFSQQATADRIDSLKNRIETLQDDSSKAEAYIDLGIEYFYYSLDSLHLALEATKQAEAIAIKKNIPKVLVTAYDIKGRAYREMGDYKKSETATRKAIATAKKGKFKKKQTQLEDNLANTLMDLGRKDEALKLKLGAYEVFKERNDSNSMEISLFGIAWIYQEEGQLEKAKKLFLEVIDLANNKESSITGLVETYGNLGIIYEQQNILDSAIYYMTKAGKIGTPYPTFMLANEAALAKVYLKQNKTTKALTTLQRVHDTYADNSNESSYQSIKLQIADILLKEGKQQEAQKYLSKIDTSIINQSFSLKSQYGYHSYNYHSRRGNYREALEYYKLYRDANDSLSNARRDSSFHLIESKYNVAKKQETINAQKLKLRSFSLGLLGLITLGLFAGLLFYNYRRKISYEKRLSVENARSQKAEIENLQQENKIISMQSMLEGQEEERKRIARDLHDNIGTLMTSIKMKVLSIQKEVESIENMNIAGELDGMIDNASQEVRRISHSMTPVALDISGLAGAIRDLEPQLAAKNIEFNANLEAIKNIDDKNLSINIYRIVQEIFNNIVKHSQADAVSVDTAIRENDLILRIRDNGTGIPKDVWEDAKSVGIESLKSRVTYLNGQIKLVADIGTHYKITIPIPTTES